MADELFVGVSGLFTLFLFWWAFRHLPRERWQFLASIPKNKGTDNGWQGVNLTYYGVFNATAYTLACTLLTLLTASAGIPLGYTLSLLILILAVCMPGSRLVARLVEKKTHTFSVGGAFFIGILLTPPLLLIAQPITNHYLQVNVNPIVFLSAVAIAYCWGEGIGRLACISFGCCYGKPLADVHPFLRKIFCHWHFTFIGRTRKIAYAHHLEGVQVLPVQAMTAVLYGLTALAGIYAFLNGAYRTALLLSLVISQLWRFTSEFLRADFRGNGRISAYQYMSLFAALYAIVLAIFIPTPPPAQSLSVLMGLSALWHPAMLLFLQALWITAFLFTGRSNVTGSTIEFHVHHHLT
ncbi:MAG: prolipoprotein diacylglyceryl transferase [Desulfobacterales bacterium]